jgi:hypothetical protein
MVEAGLLNQISTISTIVVMMGGMIFGAVRYINQQTEKKAKEAKEQAEKAQKETREYTDSKFALIKQQIENVDEKVNRIMNGNK